MLSEKERGWSFKVLERIRTEPFRKRYRLVLDIPISWSRNREPNRTDSTLHSFLTVDRNQ